MRARLRGAALFLLLWATSGFALGTLVLLGPVRWLTDALRAAGVGPGLEDTVMAGVILLFTAISVAVAAWLYRRVRDARRAGVRLGVPAGCVATAGIALWAWLHPGLVTPTVGDVAAPDARFVVGPYPDADALRELEAAGYTAVISLLHPAVVPFEPRLLAREREAARDAGIELIHAPMLPWIGDNDDAIRKIRELAERDSGRYYVHCYLGRDRVRVAARVARQAGASVTFLDEVRGRDLALAETALWERGPIYHFGDSVFVAPYPTDEEFLAFVLASDLAVVVSLLEPSVPRDTAWIRRERDALGAVDLPLVLFPIPRRPGPDTLSALVDRIRTLPRPTLVHGFRSPSTRMDGVREALRSAGFGAGSSPEPDQKTKESPTRAP